MGQPVLRFIIILFFSDLTPILCQRNEPPKWVNDMTNLRIQESTPICEDINKARIGLCNDSLVYTLLATDKESSNLRYGITTKDVFAVPDEAKGDVYLVERLDYETLSNIKITVTVTDGINTVPRDATVVIVDTNDEKPQFSQSTYSTSISEASLVGRKVMSNIYITDLDHVNPVIRVSCVTKPQFPESCQKFRIVSNNSQLTNRKWVGDLLLNEPVDFEERSIYQVTLEAFDGANKVIKDIDVNIEDIPDTPPRFTSSLNAIVDENQNIDTSVLVVHAEDGDQGIGRPIRYFLTDNPGNYFRLNQTNGNITTVKFIDREDPFFVKNNGFVKLQILVREVINNTTLGNDPLTTSTGEITITVRDENDNGPVFLPSSYTALVPENIPKRSPIPSLSLSVFDNDQGSNSKYNLTLLDHTDIFGIFPMEGEGHSSISIHVSHPEKLDYDLGQRRYRLRITAGETFTFLRRSSTATVTVDITDWNDNKPVFDATSYSASVLETAPAGTSVKTVTAVDIDSGIFGQLGVRYSLLGNGADRFNIDSRTGYISVKSCPTPGSGNCIDYEQDPAFELNFIARDSNGTGEPVTRQIVVNVLNRNDNPPQFLKPRGYIGHIVEGELVPSPTLKVQATDRDYDTIVYHILAGNHRNIWQIDSKTGVVTARRRFGFEETPGGQGYFSLTVEAYDGEFSTSVDIRINVIDKNNHAPVFTQGGKYEVRIPETAKPGLVVERVGASDADTGLNGDIIYQITKGSFDNFIIDLNSGVIRVAPRASFDFNQKNIYTLSVNATDRGTPIPFTTKASVIVHIIDANNKDPYFLPTVKRVTVREDAEVSTNITVMSATDPDQNATLRYSFSEPITAIDPQGQAVSSSNYIFKDQFLVEPNNGLVRVKKALNRDLAVTFTYRVLAVDVQAVPQQTGTGTLIITVIDVNDEPPKFGPPWTPGVPYYNLSLPEEQLQGTYVRTFVATDPDGAIQQYKITENPGEYFFMDNPNTGVVKIAKPLDYEKLQMTHFVVTAFDIGVPPFSSSATVFVEIENINDHSPRFNQSTYEVYVPENSLGGTSVIQLNASDLDLGDFGDLRFKADDNGMIFDVNNFTGLVTVHQGAALDRETTPVLTLIVTAYDSPEHPKQRRMTNIPVYVFLTDENDQIPEFLQTDISAHVIESVAIGTDVVSMSARDKDEGIYSKLVYNITGGDPNGLFNIDPDRGTITTAIRLTGHAGRHDLIVNVTDNAGKGPNSAQALVHITIVGTNTGPPRWIFPKTNNMTINVKEEQHLGLVVTQVSAIDSDGGQVSYYFIYNNTLVTRTPNFEINPNTGVITATEIYDRETKDSYSVFLVAQDQGNPPFQSPRFLTIKIVDIDDHLPSFPKFKNGSTIPYQMKVEENIDIGTCIGQVTASDADTGNFGKIIYSITAGNRDAIFAINQNTGYICTRKLIDREQLSYIFLTIQARNNVTKVKVLIGPNGKPLPDPRVVLVNIKVIDVNDNVPTFTHPLYNACVPLNAPFGHMVAQVVAIDFDSGSAGRVAYSMDSMLQYFDGKTSPRAGVFGIGSVNGSIFTLSLMSQYKSSRFESSVTAMDGERLSSTAQLRIWVTESVDMARITVKRDMQYVKKHISQYIQFLQSATNGGIICIDELRFHINANGVAIIEWTDIFFHVINGKTLTVYDAETAVTMVTGAINTGGAGAVGGEYYGLQVASAGAATGAVAGSSLLPVLIALILLLLLLFLLLMLLLCCCCPCCPCAKIAAAKAAKGRQEKGALLATGGGAAGGGAWAMGAGGYDDQYHYKSGGSHFENQAYDYDEADYASAGGGAMVASMILGGGAEGASSSREEVITKETQQFRETTSSNQRNQQAIEDSSRRSGNITIITELVDDGEAAVNTRQADSGSAREGKYTIITDVIQPPTSGDVYDGRHTSHTESSASTRHAADAQQGQSRAFTMHMHVDGMQPQPAVYETRHISQSDVFETGSLPGRSEFGGSSSYGSNAVQNGGSTMVGGQVTMPGVFIRKAGSVGALNVNSEPGPVVMNGVVHNVHVTTNEAPPYQTDSLPHPHRTGSLIVPNPNGSLLVPNQTGSLLRTSTMSSNSSSLPHQANQTGSLLRTSTLQSNSSSLPYQAQTGSLLRTSTLQSNNSSLPYGSVHQAPTMSVRQPTGGVLIHTDRNGSYSVERDGGNRI